MFNGSPPAAPVQRVSFDFASLRSGQATLFNGSPPTAPVQRVPFDCASLRSGQASRSNGSKRSTVSRVQSWNSSSPPCGSHRLRASAGISPSTFNLVFSLSAIPRPFFPNGIGPGEVGQPIQGLQTLPQAQRMPTSQLLAAAAFKSGLGPIYRLVGFAHFLLSSSSIQRKCWMSSRSRGRPAASFIRISVGIETKRTDSPGKTSPTIAAVNSW